MLIKDFLKYRAILPVIFLIITDQSFSQEYNFRTFTPAEGLAQPYVYSIVQDMQGQLWAGTSDGLSRYNGFQFKSYTTTDSLASNFVSCSFRDGEDIWFGHKNGRVSYYNGKSIHKVNKTTKDLSPVTHFAKSADGFMWVSTFSDGLFRIGNTKNNLENNILKEVQFINSFEFLNIDGLIIGTNSGLKFCKFQGPGNQEFIRNIPEIPDSKVTGIIKMRNGAGYYIATENDGIFQLTYNNSLIGVSKIVTEQFFDFASIHYIYEDSQSCVWLGTFGNGLVKLTRNKSGKFKHTIYNKGNGFSTDNVLTVYEDREGDIWSGNFNDGLTQISPKPFLVFSYDKALYGNNIFSICSNLQIRWLGTEKGLIKTDALNSRVLRFFGSKNGLPKDTVTALYTDGKKLWIGTHKNGLYVMDTGDEKILKYKIGNGILENSVTGLTGKGDHVWIGTQKGLFNINLANNKTKLYTINEGGLPHNSVNSLFLDKKERLWVSTNSTILAFIQNEKVSKIPLSSPTGILILGPVAEDSISRIWVGTRGSGVYMIQSDSIFNLTTKEGLISDYCYSIICDDYNNIWIGHRGGLSRIRVSDFMIKPIQHTESLPADIQMNPNSIVKDQSQSIWFGSDKGIISYNPSRELHQSVAPVLGITSVKINDEEIDFTNSIINLPSGKYKIKIDFLGISLKEPSLVNYQYKLDGYDQWSDITKNRTITYYRLTDGEYTFILKASNGDGVVTNTPLSISFIIAQPLWKKGWFYAASVLLMALLIYFYIKHREKKYLAEKRLLEEKVQERTNEIQVQKNKIELQRDEIDIINTNITSSITYARHIQNAMLPHKELIDELFPNNFVLYLPKDIVSGDFYWFTEKDNKIFFAVADCTGHGVPGAFMSLLGITLLNEIVNIRGITSSDAIVTALRKRVIQSLQQTIGVTNTTDGMDIALCVLDRQDNQLQYTGAMTDIIHIHNGRLEIIKADHFDVSVVYKDLGQFNMNELFCEKGDMLYLFSDGYSDQFGGEFDKKFRRSTFQNLLLEIHTLQLNEQKEILEIRLKEWMKSTSQTDDITVIGIRF